LSGGGSAEEVAPILLATAVTLVASVCQIAYLLIRRKKVDAMLWISFIVIMVFGSATIYFIVKHLLNGNQLSFTGVMP
jgi:intracellular septation protein